MSRKRQKRADITVERDREASEYIGQPRMRVQAIRLGGGQQTHDVGGAPSGAFGADKQPVLSPECDRPDRILDRIIVDRVTAILDVARQCIPAPEGVVHCFGRVALTHGRLALLDEPRLEGVQHRHRVLLAMGESCRSIHPCRFLFDAIQLGDARQGFLGQGAATGLVLLEEFSARMHPASQFGDAVTEQRFVAAVVVDHQRAAPIAKEAPGVLAATAGAKVEQHDRWSGRGAIGKQVRPLGLAASRIEHAHRRLVRMQDGDGFHLLTQAIGQGLQGHAARADPFGQRRPWQRDAAAQVDGFLTIQRQVSGAGESHPHALPEPDVSLSTHPAPITQLSISPNEEIAWEHVAEVGLTNPTLSTSDHEASCTCAAPIAPDENPVSLTHVAASMDRRARSSESSPSSSNETARAVLPSHTGSGAQGPSRVSPVASLSPPYR